MHSEIMKLIANQHLMCEISGSDSIASEDSCLLGYNVLGGQFLM